MKKMFFIAVMAIILAACSSVNDKMTWEEFTKKEPQKQELHEINANAYGKVAQEGSPEKVNFHYIISTKVETRTLTDNPICSKDMPNILEINEKSHSVAEFIVNNAGKNTELEIFMPSENAQELGFCDKTEYSVVKVVVKILDISTPSWSIEYKNQTYKLTYGMSTFEVHEMLGTPYDAKNDFLMTFSYKDGNKMYHLNFEDEKLTSVVTMDVN